MLKLYGYTVDQQGMITFPVLGKIKIGGFSESEIEKINNSLIIPDYEIVLRNKSKKIINTIKEVSKLEYKEEKKDNVVSLKAKKDRNIYKKNNFKKKNFYKKKFYKKVTK